MQRSLAFKLALVAFILAWRVVGLGAFTRLVHAGLGCPDWPTCYGHMWVPNTEVEIATANQHFSGTPVEVDKTWPEQTHRLFAKSLGLLSILLLALAIKGSPQHPWRSIVGLLIVLIAGVIARIVLGDAVDPWLWLLVGVYFINLIRLSLAQGATSSAVKLSAFIAGFIVLQGFFGMWTVTLKLWPQVVTAHLLGGFVMLATLFLLVRRLQQPLITTSANHLLVLKAYRPLALLGLGLVFGQIFLGGWVSSNYAALACLDFPTCHQSWWPSMDLASGFNLPQEIGPNYLGGVMDNDARTAIHFMHRVGAVVVSVVSLMFIAIVWKKATVPALRNGLICLFVALLVQVSLGISNVVFYLPLKVAVAHNLGGAVLLLAWVNINFVLQRLQAE